MTTRKFYKTTIRVEVLSEEPIPATLSLEEIAHEATNGDYSFEYSRTAEKELTGKQAAKALSKQGSHPLFFQLTNDGEDVE